jgi:uncharacterized Zn-binding protein involved in type VI secretion
MFPAARIGDPITHDLATPCGVISAHPPGPPPLPVVIEMLPAAYVTCLVTCTGLVGVYHPPLTAPIVKGSATVQINFRPAARWAPSGDVAACGVFLGDPKLTPGRTVVIGS